MPDLNPFAPLKTVRHGSALLALQVVVSLISIVGIGLVLTLTIAF